MRKFLLLKTFILLLSLTLIFSCSESETKKFYVSPEGNDSNPGTIEAPIATFEKAMDLVASFSGKRKVTVLFEDGTYYLANTCVFNPEHSGTKKHPVVYQAANEGKAVISGGKQLKLSWLPHEDGIYKAEFSEDVIIDQLYVNGIRQRMARFPNAVEGKNVFDTWDLTHSRNPDPARDPLDENRISTWKNPKGAYVHAMHRSLWGDMHWLVKGKNADGTLILDGGWQNNRPSPMHPRYRMVENVYEELDVLGEWFHNKDENMLYYYPDPALNIDESIIEIVRLKHLIEINGTEENPVRYLNLDGFVFRHSARSFMENKEQLLRSDWTTYRGGALFINGAEDCIISNCEFDQLGGNSIFINNYNRRITIQSCYIHHSGANGISFVGDPEMVYSPLFRYGKQDFQNIDRTPGFQRAQLPFGLPGRRLSDYHDRP